MSEKDFDMSYLSRDCIGGIFRSPIAFCGALLALATLAATAFGLFRVAAAPLSRCKPS
jgi:hypothetical protein